MVLTENELIVSLPSLLACSIRTCAGVLTGWHARYMAVPAPFSRSHSLSSEELSAV